MFPRLLGFCLLVFALPVIGSAQVTNNKEPDLVPVSPAKIDEDGGAGAASEPSLADAVKLEAASGRPQASPTGGNELLLALIKKAIADNPGFRKELEQLLGKQQGQDVKDLRDLADARSELIEQKDVTIKELQGRIRKLEEENAAKDLAIDELQGKVDEAEEKGRQPDTSPQPQRAEELVPGILVVNNESGYSVDLKINNAWKRVGPGKFEFPVWVAKKDGKVIVELVPFEAPKAWRVEPPDYTTTVNIRPRF